MAIESSGDFWRDMKSSGAVWEHSGDPRAPHVRLRGGKCSDGFIDTLQHLSQTAKLMIASDALAKKLLVEIDVRPSWVIGSPMAGIPFATVVGTRMGIPRVGFTEKINGNDQICRFDMISGSTFLDIEELTTSGGTPQRLIDAVIAKNPHVESLPYIGAFLIRCERQPATLSGKTIIPLIDLPELGVNYHEWGADCPLCAAGSRVVKNTKRVWLDLLYTMHDPLHVIPNAEYA